jgi:hypothetical protein
MKRILTKVLLLIFLSAPSFLSAAPPAKTGEFYQITVYHFANTQQQTIIEQYLKDAYLPALYRQKIKNIGVFTVIANDTAADKRLYLILPIRSLEQSIEIAASLAKDIDYQAKGKSYLEATYNNPPYTRMENIFLKAFPLAPFLNLPKLTGPKSERVYELRSYESATEKIHQNKVQMFNEGGEIDLFKQLNFNAVFYASVIAGSHMPNLMYMTCFENKADRDTHWKDFGASPVWNVLKAKPEYQNNVSKNEQLFLRATAYSDY